MRACAAFGIALAMLAGCTVPEPSGPPLREVTAFSLAQPNGVWPGGWQPWRLSKLKRLTSYQLVDYNGSVVGKALSAASASGLVHPVDIDPRQTPILQWRWKVPHLIAGADNGRRATEDAPVRVVVSFDGDVESLPLPRRGIGLAANQVGIPQQLCVIDLSLREEKAPLFVLINPVIVERKGIVEADEGCLSIPGYLTAIRRAEKVYVQGINGEGKDVSLEAEGLLARALQHELDHLAGLLFIDRMTSIKREFFKRRYKKQMNSTTGK